MDALILLGLGALSFLLAFYGAAVGLVLGHLRLPLLVMFVGSPAVGAATNLAISGVGALSGTLRHMREGRVSWHTMLLMGVPSGLGALAGVHLIDAVDPMWGKLIIGFVLVATGANMAANRAQKSEPISLPRRLFYFVEACVGVVLGVLAGIVGLMMGGLRMPVMVRVLRLDPRIAVGTNNAISCFTAAAGVAAALAFAGNGGLDWIAIAAVAPPTILGAYLGAKWTGKIKKESLVGLAGWTIFFSGLVLLGESAIKMLF